MSGTGPPTGAFAANEDEAESGRRVPSLPRSKTMEKEKPDMDDSPSTAEDGPFSQYCTDNAPIWKLYMDQAKISDDNLANIFNSDLDPLLIFAGLFSAILSAFLIEIRKGLQEDLQNITNNLLLILIENQHNVTGPQVPSSAHFEPTSSSRWINGLWFSSLMFSLMSALGASLAKGWVTQFSSSVSGSSWGDAALHCRRFRGLKRWHLKLIVQCLPILIHIAFFLFSIGLVILVFQDDTAIGIAILILTALILGLYIASSVHSVHSVDSPFRTPLSGMIRRLFNGPWRLEAFTAFPEQQETQKAQALAWLLAESQNGDTITAAIRAIAGLPATPIVQDELLRPASVGLLSRTLSSELAKPASDPETSRSCLYAIIHLVQTGPADAEDTISLGILGDLIDSGGPLAITDSLPAGIREIALCIKARIWLLIWGNAPDTILFDTELPVLLKACEPGHLRRLLFQVRLLASRPGNTPAMSALCPSSDDFCAILRDGNAVNRNQVHAELVKTAASGTDLTDSGIKFGARTLLEGMTTGSTELRRCYAELFSDLATDAAFRNTIKHSGVETEICSLLQTEDDHVRKHVVVALGIFASDDYTRIVITTGLRATINSMLVEDVPVFWAIARFLADVARHDDIRTNVVNSGLLNSIMSRTDPEDEKGFKIAVGVVGELGEYEDIRAASTAAAIIDFWLNIRSAAGMQGLVALAKHNDVLQTIATPQNTERIINVLNSLEWRMSMSVVDSLLALVMRNSAVGAIFVPKILDKIFAMLGDQDKDVQQAAVKAAVVLAQDASVRDRLLSARSSKGILKMLEDGDWRVRNTGLNVIVGLVETGSKCVALFTSETIDKIFLMLGDRSDIRTAAVNLVVALAHDAGVREMLLSAGSSKGILKMLEDSNWLVRMSTLNVITGLVGNGSECAALFIPETIDKIFMMLGDENSDIKKAAIKAVVTLANDASVRENLLTAGNLKRILKILEDSKWWVRNIGLNVIAGLVVNGSKCAALFIPETLDKIFAMLGDQNEDVQQAAVKAVVALAHDASVREKLLSAGNSKGILQMLENGKGTVRKAGLDIIVALVGNGSECAAIFIPEIIDKMFAMFGDQNKDVQRAAVKAVVVLTHDASVRDKLLLAGNSKAILKMLEDYSGLLRMSALNAIAALVENRSQGAALFIPEIIDKIFAMLGDEDPNRQTAAVKLVVAISRSDVSVRENLLTAGSSKGILKMLEDSNWRIRLSTLNVIAGLVENGSECAAFFIPETIDKIFMTLEDKDYNVLKAAVKLVVVSSQDASVREKLLTAGNIKRVLKMLDNGYWRVRNTGLHLITGLVKNGSECAAIFIPETIDKIFAMVADEDKDVRATGVKLVVAFALNIPHGISTPETIQKIIRLLRHEHPAVKHIALSTLDTLASLESFRFFVSTPQNLVHILQALTGNWDDQIISCIGRIISFGHDIPSVTIVLTNATLNGLPQMAPEVRKSYCRVISLLPLAAVTIPLENMQKLFVLLWDRDADIANSAMEILICLTANAQCRKHILNHPNFWKLAVKLIQHPPTSRHALKTITALAKYDDARREILQSSDISHTLLTMLKSGTADINRWEVGLKGLLALGLL